MKKFSSRPKLPTFTDVNARDIVDFLKNLGYLPTRTSHPSYWFLSPLRSEKTASFKVNRKLNRWFDFGIQEGGGLVDFCILYYHCNPLEALEKFSATVSGPMPPNQVNVPLLQATSTMVENWTPSGIRNLTTQPLRTQALFNYLRRRRISEKVAQRYCLEAHYQVGEKSYYAIAFPNGAGGFELRNTYFKGSSSPKAMSFISRHAKRIFVFEGFFDMLSFETISQALILSATDLLVLNSVAFLNQAIPLLNDYSETGLFLDNDSAGDKATEKALYCHPNGTDYRPLYKGHKDLNQWLCKIGFSIPESSKKVLNKLSGSS